tara:strand:+ start:85 stop:243 length:159 start_codon:yes stop_codon:yes gene_type:complete
MAGKKGKMPPQLLEYFKNRNEKDSKGEEKSDKDKRKEALDKAIKAKDRKEDK